MSRSRSPRRWRLALLTTVLAATGFGTGAGAVAPPPAAAVEGCSMPDCYAAIAFNPKTGFWVVAKNYPTKKAARDQVDRTCRSQEARDRHCTVLRTSRGETCLGTAMKVKDGKVVQHETVVRDRYRTARDDAAAKLDGRPQLRHPVAGVCNG